MVDRFDCTFVFLLGNLRIVIERLQKKVLLLLLKFITNLL